MAAKYILAVLAVVFLAAAAIRGFRGPQARTWLLVAAIFTAVSLWLFSKG
jgi:EamA domain-containing membrane protein RarD